MPNIWEPEIDPETWKAIDPIQGWLTIYEGTVLYNLAQTVEEFPIVEIGSWKGRSSACLGLGSIRGHGVFIYCVDPFNGGDERVGDTYAGFSVVNGTYSEWCSNMDRLGLSEHCIPVVKTSKEAAPNFGSPIGLLFIDGNHTHQGIQEDYDLWSPKILPGGYLAIHDVHPTWPGPYDFSRWVREDPAWEFVCHCDSLLVMRKK